MLGHLNGLLDHRPAAWLLAMFFDAEWALSASGRPRHGADHAWIVLLEVWRRAVVVSSTHLRTGDLEGFAK